MKILKFVVPLFLIAFLLRSIAGDWREVAHYWSTFSPVPLIISFLLLLTIYPEAAFSWYVLLKKIGIKVPLENSIAVWILSTTSRYIPGVIWQYVGRVELSQRRIGIRRNVTVISLLFEIFLAATAAVVASFLSLPIFFEKNLLTGIWVLLVPIPLVVLHPKISTWAISIIAKLMKKRVKWNLQKLGILETLQILPLYIANFLLNGIALYFLILSFGGHLGFSDIFHLTGIYSLSWLIGFISVFAPAGIGVADVTLAYFLSFMMPLPIASFIALAYRVFLTLSELVIFSLVLRLEGK